VIHGGWNGVLASLLYNSEIPIDQITSVDIDENCEVVANMINKRQEINSQFCAVTCDMCIYDYKYIPDIVINTSTEHITEQQYITWLSRVPESSLVVLQSNNYIDLPDHIRCSLSLEDFSKSSKLTKLLYSGTLELPLYDRYLLIGYK
jgi:hypothetical protein